MSALTDRLQDAMSFLSRMSAQGWVCAEHAEAIEDAIAALTARSATEPIDRGPWKSGCDYGRHFFVESAAFDHDVRLYVNGDFGSDEQMLKYAEGIAAMLNAASQAAYARPEEKDTK